MRRDKPLANTNKSLEIREAHALQTRSRNKNRACRLTEKKIPTTAS